MNKIYGGLHIILTVGKLEESCSNAGSVSYQGTASAVPKGGQKIAALAAEKGQGLKSPD